MPKILEFNGYIIYFWSNEKGEPIHVHISKRRPVANATKIWITHTGECIVASNGSRIPSKTLRELTEFISAMLPYIYVEWKKRRGTDDIIFYR